MKAKALNFVGNVLVWAYGISMVAHWFGIIMGY